MSSAGLSASLRSREQRIEPDTVALKCWGAVEKAVALLALVLSAPVALGVATAIVILSGGRSPLVAHRRVGRDGDRFWMWKLRTMWPHSPGGRRGRLVERLADETLPAAKSSRDPRVPNRFAALLRKYSVDELPQLVHVLTGSMALVGPRPMLQSELDVYYGASAREVLRMPPGVTGLWQVLGRSRLSYEQRRRLDIEFARSRSVRLNAAILLRTIPAVLSGRDAW